MTGYAYPDGTLDLSVGRVTSPYGPRKAPKPGASALHLGVDIVGFVDKEVRACADGRVLGSGVLPGWAGGGNQVYLDHEDGYFTRSLHFARLLVPVGREVARGDVIGIMGMTGTATGPHLHLEVRNKYGAAVDPLQHIARNLAAPTLEGKAPDMYHVHLKDTSTKTPKEYRGWQGTVGPGVATHWASTDSANFSRSELPVKTMDNWAELVTFMRAHGIPQGNIPLRGGVFIAK